MLKIGDLAPAFTLKAQDNRDVSLADYRGQRVLLFFYPKAATSGCTTQACGLRDNFRAFQTAHTAVLGISPDDPATLARWHAKEKFPYLLLADTDHTVAEAYDVWGEKSLYGNKYMGVIRSHFIVGPDGRLADVQYKISPMKSIEKAVKFVG